MKQVIVKKGRIATEDVAPPQLEPATALISVHTSSISAGTETAAVADSGVGLLKKVASDPAKAATVAKNMLASRGLSKTRAMVQSRVNASRVLGYSAAGTVTSAGSEIHDLQDGDRVACAGAGLATHAELVRVPRNLIVRLPDHVSFEDGATVTLGAIALQGVRRFAPTLGETIVVLGLGILGLLTVQILRASGCRTIGLDLDDRRVKLAKSLGADDAFDPNDELVDAALAALTDGFGADGVIITAASDSESLLGSACRLCRKKGRVVVVGDIALSVDRSDIYEKEIDLLVSTSYGPGRYDRRYEYEGLDYPIGYVRWTENRNMAAYIDLLARGQIDLAQIHDRSFDVSEAELAYEHLRTAAPKPLLVQLTYPEHRQPAEMPSSGVSSPTLVAGSDRPLGLAVVGAGTFAVGTHLPNLARLGPLLKLEAVVARSGSKANDIATQFGAPMATTSLEEALNCENVQAVLIATRHDLHAKMALQALKAGKHVLVEKPTVLSVEERDALDEFLGEPGSRQPMLMTAFNRRYSPAIEFIVDRIADRFNPMQISYRMNAGYLPPDHWTQGAEGGGRNLGEACHIYDLFQRLTGALPRTVHAQAIRPTTANCLRNDNFTTVIGYGDGSVASLTYSAQGDASFSKEQMDLFCDGVLYRLTDYQSVEVYGRSDGWRSRVPNKGHLEELEVFAAAARKAGEWPVSWAEQRAVIDVALAAEACLMDQDSSPTAIEGLTG